MTLSAADRADRIPPRASSRQETRRLCDRTRLREIQGEDEEGRPAEG